MQNVLLVILFSAVISIVYGIFLAKNVLRKSAGNAKMQEIARAIQEGARAYLYRQYKTVAYIAAVLFFGLGLLLDWATAFSFLVGAGLSALAGIIGMTISVRANVRTAQAAKSGIREAFAIAV